MFLLPKCELKLNQVSPVFGLIKGDFARSVWKLPRQLCLINLFQYPSQKDDPLLSNILAAVILDICDMQVINYGFD